MSDRENHCPFLNRADHRCSGYFSIERLQHAFEHCFHAYKSCGTYHELLVERQSRRSQQRDGTATRATSVTTQFVQVRLPGAVHAQQDAGVGIRA